MTRLDSDPTSAAAAQAVVPHLSPYRWAMLTGAWLIYFAFGMTTAAMAPLVAPITADFGLSYGAMGLIFSAWPLIYIATAVSCGTFVDRFGLRRALLVSGLVMAASGAWRGLATDPYSLFASVALFGVGAPLISIGGPKLIALWFRAEDRGLAMGIFSTSTPLGSVCALALTNSVVMPLFGGNWRLVVLFYAGFTFVATAIWFLVSAHAHSRASEQQGAGGAPVAQLDVLKRLLSLRLVRALLWMSIGVFFFNHALNNWLPEILRTGGMDPVAAGYWASIPTTIGILSAFFLPRAARPARRTALVIGLFLCGALATQIIAVTTKETLLVVALVLQGIARGAIRPILMLALIDDPAVGARHAGAAGGLFFSVAELGGVLGPLTVGYLYDATGGFSLALGLLTAICLAMALVQASLIRSKASDA